MPRGCGVRRRGQRHRIDTAAVRAAAAPARGISPIPPLSNCLLTHMLLNHRLSPPPCARPPRPHPPIFCAFRPYSAGRQNQPMKHELISEKHLVQGMREECAVAR